MAVRATKPEINVREKITELESKADFKHAFVASASSNNSAVTVGSNSKLTTFTYARINTGCYDEENSMFVAPVSGLYVLTLNLLVKAAGVDGWLVYRVNGSDIVTGSDADVVYGSSGEDQTVTMTNIFALAAGDRVEAYTRNAGCTYNSHHSFWVGHQIN